MLTNVPIRHQPICFITETECVYCAVRADRKVHFNLSISKLTTVMFNAKHTAWDTKR
jgi:hypothetical protein